MSSLFFGFYVYAGIRIDINQQESTEQLCYHYVNDWVKLRE